MFADEDILEEFVAAAGAVARSPLDVLVGGSFSVDFDAKARADYNRRWWAANPHKAALYQRRWRAKNPPTEDKRHRLRKKRKLLDDRNPQAHYERTMRAYFKRRNHWRLWKLCWLCVMLGPEAATWSGLEVPAPPRRRQRGRAAPPPRQGRAGTSRPASPPPSPAQSS